MGQNYNSSVSFIRTAITMAFVADVIATISNGVTDVAKTLTPKVAPEPEPEPERGQKKPNDLKKVVGVHELRKEIKSVETAFDAKGEAAATKLSQTLDSVKPEHVQELLSWLRERTIAAAAGEEKEKEKEIDAERLGFWRKKISSPCNKVQGRISQHLSGVLRNRQLKCLQPIESLASIGWKPRNGELCIVSIPIQAIPHFFKTTTLKSQLCTTLSLQFFQVTPSFLNQTCPLFVFNIKL